MPATAQNGLGARAADAVDLPGWGLVGPNRPCRTIGGDYFDFAPLGSHLLLALGDVSGKGTGAALLMTMLRAAVRAHWADGLPSGAYFYRIDAGSFAETKKMLLLK